MRKLIAATVLVVAVFFVLYFAGQRGQGRQRTQPSKHSSTYMLADFYTGFTSPPKYEPIQDRVYGGIVSHHFYAERQIAAFFLAMSSLEPDTVIVVGPNHFNNGSAMTLISEYAYQTPWGDLAPDREMAGKLIASGLAKVEERPFDYEHSVALPSGFIRKVFPQARFVPIILKHTMTQEAEQELAQKLYDIASDRTLVLASADFTHESDYGTARRQDAKTAEILKNFDTAGIQALSPFELDSPSSVNVLLKYLELINAKKMTYINTNSAELSGNFKSDNVTSYFFAHFTK